MSVKKNFPYVVAGYIIATGVFFCMSTLIEGALLDLEPPGRYVLLAVSIIFIGAGIYSVYLVNRGKLRRAGKSVTEVRREAVEKIKDPSMLAQIALEDQNPVIQKTAEKRLKKLNK
jgi:hypothetical protein